jgi:PadR family transcriptional regulator PadR
MAAAWPGLVIFLEDPHQGEDADVTERRPWNARLCLYLGHGRNGTMPRGSEAKMTLQELLVVRAMLAEPDREMYGLEIRKAVGLSSGTLHPILARLERRGWLESRWEDIEPKEEGRPRRRYYHLSPSGAERAPAALANAHISAPAPSLVADSALKRIPRLSGGV